MWSFITGFLASFFRGWLKDMRGESAQREIGARQAREQGHADIERRAQEAERRADALRTGELTDVLHDPNRRD